VSCRIVSNEALARIIPVNPPAVNKKIKPRAHSIAGSYLIGEPKIVASHLNTLMPVGTAMIIVAAVK
jgi:hypothetical protein